MKSNSKILEELAALGSDARSIIVIAGDAAGEAVSDEAVYRLHAIIRLAELQCEAIRRLCAEVDAESI